MENSNRPKISPVEWGLVTGALLVVDLVQIALDLVAVGVAINRFIDIFVGLAFSFYLQLRGRSMAKPARLFGVLGAFVLELIPVVDAFPFWVLDGIYNAWLDRKETRKIAKEEKATMELENAKIREFERAKYIAERNAEIYDDDL